jgi:hypothetical protein
MKIEVLCSINSGQYDKGSIVDLPEKQAQALIKAGAAKKTKEKPISLSGDEKEFSSDNEDKKRASPIRTKKRKRRTK